MSRTSRFPGSPSRSFNIRTNGLFKKGNALFKLHGTRVAILIQQGEGTDGVIAYCSHGEAEWPQIPSMIASLGVRPRGPDHFDTVADRLGDQSFRSGISATPPRMFGSESSHSESDAAGMMAFPEPHQETCIDPQILCSQPLPSQSVVDDVTGGSDCVAYLEMTAPRVAYNPDISTDVNNGVNKQEGFGNQTQRMNLPVCSETNMSQSRRKSVKTQDFKIDDRSPPSIQGLAQSASFNWNDDLQFTKKRKRSPEDMRRNMAKRRTSSHAGTRRRVTRSQRFM